MTTFRNRKTGEVVTLNSIGLETQEMGAQAQAQPDLLGKITQAEQETPGRIAERGPIQQELGQRLGAALPGGGEPGGLAQAKDIAMLGLTGASVPVQAIESGIANPLLQLQKAVPSPRVEDEQRPTVGGLLGETAKGLTLQKRGKFEDVFRGAGVPETPAMIAGLSTSLVIPIGVANKIKRTFGTLSKASDANILKAGKDVIKSTDEAAAIVGPKVDEAFSAVNTLKSDGTKFLKGFNKLPDVIKNKAQEVFGNIDDFATDLPIAKLREFKRWLGKLRPQAFGKEAKGAVERVDDININEAYATVKKLIRETIKDGVGGNAGSKASKLVMDAEENFTELMRAVQFLKKSTVDPTLKVPTKAGLLARKVSKEGDVTARAAINIIKKAGGSANKTMNKAIDALNKFNRSKDIANVMRRLVSGATIGGVAGAVGRGIFGKSGGGGGGLIDTE